MEKNSWYYGTTIIFIRTVLAFSTVLNVVDHLATQFACTNLFSSHHGTIPAGSSEHVALARRKTAGTS